MDINNSLDSVTSLTDDLDNFTLIKKGGRKKRDTIDWNRYKSMIDYCSSSNTEMEHRDIKHLWKLIGKADMSLGVLRNALKRMDIQVKNNILYKEREWVQ